jgi:adhesin transport system membrane fusion protein
MIALLSRIVRGVGRLLDPLCVGSQGLIDRLLKRVVVPEKNEGDEGFAVDTDYAILQQEPLRARILLRSISIAIAIAVMWAAVSRIDEVTRGEVGVVFLPANCRSCRVSTAVSCPKSSSERGRLLIPSRSF